MRVIPSKLVPAGKQPLGVKNFSELEVEIVKLLPNHANSTQVYSPLGVNRMTFRIPAFTNSFMDNSRSFLSYKIQLTGVTGADANNMVKLTDVPGGWIDRLTIKSSNGLVLEDISNYNVLKKILTLMETEELAKTDEGNYSGVTTKSNKVLIGVKQATAPVTYTLKFNTGILSQHLSSYLPLAIMDKGTFAFDVEFHLSAPVNVAYRVHNDGPDGTNPVTNLGFNTYEISDPCFNICLIKVDESICKKYHQIACDENERVVIPYETYHNHQASISSPNQTVFISDNCTDLKRVYSVFHGNTNVGLPVNTQPYPFVGSVHEADANKVVGYNYKLGNKFIYNEEVAETDNNNISLNHFLNAHYKGAKPCCPAMYIAKLNMEEDDDTWTSNYESNKSFVLCPNFTYSEEASKTIQGVSAGGLPITATFKFGATPSLTNNNFVQCGYQLVIENGQLSYAENKLGEHSY